MAKAIIHAQSSVRKWGGTPEDYFSIHEFLDSSKGPGGCASNAHRALTHQASFAWVCDRVFDPTFTVLVDVREIGEDGELAVTGQRPKIISTRDIVEQHNLEDTGGKFFPTFSDYAVGLDVQDWMCTTDHDSALDHARRSASRFGGDPHEYLAVHELMNLYQNAADDRRSLMGLHHTWGIWVMEKAFGYELTLSSGEPVPVRLIAQQHVEHDLGFIPSAQEYLDHLAYQPWFNNGMRGCPDSYKDKTVPDSYRKIEQMKAKTVTTRRQVYSFD